MRTIPWTATAARIQSVLHFLIAPLMLWVGVFGLQEVCSIFSWSPPNLLGLLLGAVLGLLVALMAWGLWNRHNWARRLAMLFHGGIVIAALRYGGGCLLSCLMITGNEDGVHAPLDVLVKMLGGIAFIVFVTSSGVLWWLWRVRG